MNITASEKNHKGHIWNIRVLLFGTKLSVLVFIM
jgi:hypothetical protein